jgi:ribonuclease HI
VLQEGNLFLGRRTNNEAEYEAVIRSLRAASKLGAVDVALRSDSELLVRQINGQYRVRDERLALLHRTARDLIRTFRRFEARHVPREANSAADAQANLAIDQAAERL